MAGKTSDFLGTGWRFPVGLQGGRVAVCADETLIAQSIRLILGTSKGERVMEPEFGCDLRQLVFSANNNANAHLAEHAVQSALERWEPRIRLLGVSAAADPSRMNVLLISIDYLIRSYNSRHNLVYPYYLG